MYKLGAKAWALALRARPKGQRLSAAIQWPAIFGGFQRELAPAGALLFTERKLVLTTKEKQSPRQHAGGDVHHFGGIVTYFPLARLADFHVSHHERFGVLALQAHAAHDGDKLEIILPSHYESAVSKAMEQACRHRQKQL